MDARPAPCRMRVGEAYAQPAEPRRPIAVDPPLVGAGRRRGRHVKAALAHGRTLAVSAAACSTHPGSSAAGWRSRNHPRTATRRRIPGHPGAGAPPPGGALAATRDCRQFADGAGVRSLTPRGHVAARPGRLPATPHPSTVCRSAAAPGLPAVRASCRASGVTAAERQRPACAQAAASAARCGPP